MGLQSSTPTTSSDEKEKVNNFKTENTYEPVLVLDRLDRNHLEDLCRVHKILDEVMLKLEALGQMKEDGEKANLQASDENNINRVNKNQRELKTLHHALEPIKELSDKIQDHQVDVLNEDSRLEGGIMKRSEETFPVLGDNVDQKHEDENSDSIIKKQYTIFKTDDPNHLKERILCHRLFGDQDKSYDEKARIVTEALDVFNGIHSKISKFIRVEHHDSKTYKDFLETLDEILTEDVGPLDFPTDPQDRHRFKFGDEDEASSLPCSKRDDNSCDPALSAIDPS